MKKLIYILAISLFFFTSCKKEKEVISDGSAFGDLTTYLVENDMDIPDVVSGWITARPAELAGVPEFINKYNIIDLRSADVYAAGHIEGAKNSTLANVLTTAESFTADKPILVVCYTGQTAAHAVVALRLSGYMDAVTLKWGMSGWDASLDKWTPNLGDAASNGGWVAAPGSPKATETFEFPNLDATASDAEEILKERVELLLSNGFKGVNSADVLANPSNYFVNNFWAATDLEHYGHIEGAYRIQPLSIENDIIKGLDASKTVVTYCWTGQTSSMITAYLNVIGYNAVSLKFGSNSMIYNTLESHKFVAPTVDYPTVQ
jgi:rhodanese-related sulfurtransferase